MAILVISYSRADQAQVRALVSLLKAGLRDVERAVFWDEQFEPGESWFDQLKAHIDASPQLFVFWCDHSNSSEQVRREFTYALTKKKRVVPVLLDDTPLAVELAPIHGIDLRGAIRHGRKSRPETARRIGPAAAVAAAVVLVAFLSLYNTIRLARPGPAPPDAVGQGPPAFVSELVLDGKDIADSRGELNDQSKARVDEFFQRKLVDPETAEVLIESHSDDPEHQSADAVMGYVIERQYVPLTGIVVRRDGTATNPLKNQTVLKLRTTHPPADYVSAQAVPLAVRLFLGAVILAMSSASAWLSFLGLQRWKRRRFIMREFARHLA